MKTEEGKRWKQAEMLRRKKEANRDAAKEEEKKKKRKKEKKNISSQLTADFPLFSTPPHNSMILDIKFL